MTKPDKCTACGEPAVKICDAKSKTHVCGLPLCAECVHQDACWKAIGAKTTIKGGKPRKE